jgi:hypothetical protein
VHAEINSDNSFNRSNDSNSDKPKQRKNREVENLINMDFGPGKTPFVVSFDGDFINAVNKFQTTSAELYTENVLTSRERIQSHVSSGCKFLVI